MYRTMRSQVLTATGARVCVNLGMADKGTGTDVIHLQTMYSSWLWECLSSLH